jgi:hypothetical protein
MLNICREYTNQEEEVSMLNVCLKNGEKRWVNRHEANLLQRNGQIVFVEEIITEDADIMYNL